MPARNLFVILLLFVSTVQAADSIDIAGIKLDKNIDHGSGKILKLNGAGIRKKLFLKIYAGALYLEEKTINAETIINSGKANRVLMHFIYDGVSKNKITDAWNTGFEKNLDTQTFDKLKDRITAFNALFTDTKAGDRILLDYIPDRGTTVTMNGTIMGTIPGRDFNSALLAIWLGKQPVTSALKDAMLGK